MSTVRIYRVAELLNTTSQEVLALLKKAHGIELKSASSSLEEIVARQFVDRLAKQRGVELPKGDIFSEDAAKTTSKAKALSGKKGAAAPAAEPPKPVVPTLGPPRLIKKAKPAEPGPEASVELAVDHPPVGHAVAAVVESVDAVVATEPQKTVIATTSGHAEAGAVATADPAVVRSAPEAAKEKAGRFVPPSIRLRVEEPGQAPPTAPPLQPRRQLVHQPPRVAPPAAPRPAQAATGNLARPAGQRPPYSQRPPGGATAAMLGGPRPLPAQPVRPATGFPARPGMRPGGFRPHRPGGPRPAQRRDALQRPQTTVAPEPPPPITRTVAFSEGMTVKDLADRLDIRVKDALKSLFDRRVMMTINSAIDLETATTMAAGFGAEIQTRTFEQEIIDESDKTADPLDLIARSPVVTIMGHVDHGKTTLLDAIRETRVAEREAGGITQHIGAYLVAMGGDKAGKSIVFLDTPGHSAFTMMRARGAKVTDVVVLVVAADDGVMPQTKEAIDHAKAANVKIVVAVNKIDLPGANPEVVKRQLSDLGLMPEEWGGQTVFVEVSAKKKQNLDALLEMILLVTEIDDLKANPKRSALGTVLETKLDRGRGPVATVLVQDGTIRVGDSEIAGPVVGKVRALIDDRGRNLKEAGPSTPVELLGLESLPSPGDRFQTVADPAKARQISSVRQIQAKEKSLGARARSLP